MTTASGNSSSVEVTFDSIGLSGGVYTSSLCVTSNDPIKPLVVIPVTFTVDDNADLSLTKTAPAESAVGETFMYTLEVTNAGPATALNTVVIDNLPTGVKFISATAGCSEAAGIVTCNLGDLSSSATVTLEIFVKVEVTGLLTNTAHVSSASPDPDLSNNSDSAGIDAAPAKIYLPIIVRD